MTGFRMGSEGTVFWVTYTLLWLLVAILAFAVMMLLREHVRTLRSLREGRSLLGGPPEGARAPDLPEEARVRGRNVRAELPRIVVFLGVRCQACWGHRPAVSAFAEDRADLVEVEVSCVGSRTEVVEFVEEMWNGVRVYADPEGRISGAWRVFMTPFVVAVDEEGRVSRKLATPNFDDLVMLLGEMRDGRSGDGRDEARRAG